MLAVYEVPVGRQDEQEFCDVAPPTRSDNGATRGDITCTSKCHSVALGIHSALIVALLGISIYVLQMPKTDDAVLNRLAKAESEMAALKIALDRAETNIASFESEVAALKNSQASAEAKFVNFTDAVLNRLAKAESEMAALKIALDRAETNIASFESEVAALKNSQASAEAKFVNFTEAYQTPMVVFTARGIASKDIVKGQPLIFPTVQSNDGGGYDPSTGVFTAPYSGLYMFTTTVCAVSGKDVVVHLVAAGNSKASTRKYNNDDGVTTCTSISSVAVLNTGETASINGAFSNTNATFTGSSYKWPSFAGMLVHRT